MPVNAIDDCFNFEIGIMPKFGAFPLGWQNEILAPKAKFFHEFIGEVGFAEFCLVFQRVKTVTNGKMCSRVAATFVPKIPAKFSFRS